MIQGVPPGLRRQVRDAFVAALRTNPKLANGRVIRTWMVWDGKATVNEPPLAALPAIQIRLLGGPVKRLATNRLPGKPITYINESNLTVLIDLMVAGNDQADVGDLADLIYAALAPQDDDARAVLQVAFRNAGIKDWELRREILPASAESFSEQSVVGQGSYDLTLFWNS